MTGNARQQPPDRSMPGSKVHDAGPGDHQPPVLDQAFDGDSLFALRAAVAAHGLRAGLAEGRIGDLVLAVHELAANAVRHGAGRGRLRVWNTGEALRCEVTDGGAPQAAGPDRAAVAAPDPSRWTNEPGHGLWMIRRVADQASLQGGSSGTLAVVSFTLEPPARLGLQDDLETAAGLVP